MACPATAKPSARSEDVSQTCKQIWNAAMGVAPSLAANDVANVTPIVAATTLANIREPACTTQILQPLEKEGKI